MRQEEAVIFGYFESINRITHARFLLTAGLEEATLVRIGSEANGCDEAITTQSKHSIG